MLIFTFELERHGRSSSKVKLNNLSLFIFLGIGICTARLSCVDISCFYISQEIISPFSHEACYTYK